MGDCMYRLVASDMDETFLDADHAGLTRWVIISPPRFLRCMGDCMYRLVASDMDETFLDADHAIPASNLRALKRMRIISPPRFLRCMGDCMYRLVASDMDETFLDADHAIPASNLRALKRMRELGVLFVPSSGRWDSSIMDNFSGEARELIEDGYVLSYNGGFINRVGDPTPLTTCGLSNECANAIYAKGLELGLCMHVKFLDHGQLLGGGPRADRRRLCALL